VSELHQPTSERNSKIEDIERALLKRIESSIENSSADELYELIECISKFTVYSRS